MNIHDESKQFNGEVVGEAWIRQDDETGPAYKAFCTYRDLGPGRSLDAAYCQAQGLQKGSKRVSGFWQRWYRNNDWKSRAAVYDAHLELRARNGREDEYLKELQVLRDRQKKLAQVTLNAAVVLLQKANERLGKLDPANIDTRTLPSYFRAAAVIAEAATNAEATALGLHELITLLDA